MSLEIAIQQNTAAIERLIGILTETLPQPVTVNIGEIKEAAAEAVEEKPKAKRAKKEAAPALAGEQPEAPASEPSAHAPEPGASAASETEAAAAATEPTAYADVAAATTRLIKARGTPFAKEMLRANGWANAKEIPPESWDAWIAEVEQVLFAREAS